MPLMYNPAFAGSAGNSRLVTNFSYQYGEYSSSNYFDHNYGMNLSFDTYIPKIRSGVGITTDHNKGHKYYYDRNYDRNNNSLSLIVAPKISIKGKYTISPSFEFSYMDLYYEYFNYDQRELNGIERSFFTSRFGLLFNAKHYYVGYDLLLSNDFKYDFTAGTYGALHFGYCIQKNEDSKFSFTPQFVLPISVYTDSNSSKLVYDPLLLYTLNFRYNNFLLGAVNNSAYWYPTGIMAGWQKNHWRIMMNHSFVNEYNFLTRSYRVDLSFRYIFNKDKKSVHIFD